MLKSSEQVLNDNTDKKETVFTKSARIAAKKSVTNTRKYETKKNINLVEETQEVASKKCATIAAKKNQQ